MASPLDHFEAAEDCAHEAMRVLEEPEFDEDQFGAYAAMAAVHAKLAEVGLKMQEAEKR